MYRGNHGGVFEVQSLSSSYGIGLFEHVIHLKSGEVQRGANIEAWVNEQIGFKEDPAAGIRPPEVNEEGLSYLVFIS